MFYHNQDFFVQGRDRGWGKVDFSRQTWTFSERFDLFEQILDFGLKLYKIVADAILNPNFPMGTNTLLHLT